MDSNSILDHNEKLSMGEAKKRELQEARRPRVYEKIKQFHARSANGVISPILRLKINRSLCNFKCEHCCEEPYMTRDLKRRTGLADPRTQMTIADYAKLADEADSYGIFRFVLTGGEALLDKKLGDLMAALDPTRHLLVLDTNGWFFDQKRAEWFAAQGGYKAQISLDSYFASEHDKFRNKKGSHKRVIAALEEAKNAGLELLLSTCIVRDRVFSDEFKLLCEYTKDNEIPLYVTLAKPVGSARGHEEWVCTKKDVDELKRLEYEYKIFTHMTPSYGNPGKCITVKGINTINHDGELIPCPYMDLSIGNVTKESLGTILDRGMRNKWLGPYRDECIIGENQDFIRWHNKTVADYATKSPLLPVPYQDGFALTESL